MAFGMGALLGSGDQGTVGDLIEPVIGSPA
jgi:hypothetical protein